MKDYSASYHPFEIPAGTDEEWTFDRADFQKDLHTTLNAVEQFIEDWAALPYPDEETAAAKAYQKVREAAGLIAGASNLMKETG